VRPWLLLLDLPAAIALTGSLWMIVLTSKVSRLLMPAGAAQGR
jgi:hypothetical protein